MGLFGPSKKERAAAAETWEGHAAEASKNAQEAAQKAAAHKKRLETGKSQDRAADRYFLRQAEEDRRLHEANARDFRKNAGTSRKLWR